MLCTNSRGVYLSNWLPVGGDIHLSVTLLALRTVHKHLYSCKEDLIGGPFVSWKICVNPIENHVISNFTGKNDVIFSKPLSKIKNVQGPLFASGPPYVSEWFFRYKFSFYLLAFRKGHVHNLLPEHQWWRRTLSQASQNHTSQKTRGRDDGLLVLESFVEW